MRKLFIALLLIGMIVFPLAAQQVRTQIILSRGPYATPVEVVIPFTFGNVICLVEVFGQAWAWKRISYIDNNGNGRPDEGDTLVLQNLQGRPGANARARVLECRIAD